jgi:hypothetical protein
MNHRQLVPKAAKRFAMATALFALLGTFGCMTRHEAVMSAAGDVASTTWSTIDPAGAKCAQFGCEP